MYGAAYGWPRQSWSSDPAPIGNILIRPYNLQPGIFQRDATVDGNSTNGTDSSDVVCHVDLNRRDDGATPDTDVELDYDKLLFLGMDGNRVDGRTCHVIYEDADPDFIVRIVMDEDGNVVDMYMGDASEGLWQCQETPSSTTTVRSLLHLGADRGGREPGERRADTYYAYQYGVDQIDNGECNHD